MCICHTLDSCKYEHCSGGALIMIDDVPSQCTILQIQYLGRRDLKDPKGRNQSNAHRHRVRQATALSPSRVPSVQDLEAKSFSLSLREIGSLGRVPAKWYAWISLAVSAGCSTEKYSSDEDSTSSLAILGSISFLIRYPCR